MKLHVGFAAGWMLAASVLTLQAQPTPLVALNVVALDSAGNPVTDLTAADFTVLDNGSRQQIAALRLNQSAAPTPVVILFDLMNLNIESRGAVENAVKTSLAKLPANDSLYLYLFTENGALYPVHGLDSTADAEWPKDATPLLDAALQKVNQLRPQDIRSSSPIGLPVRFNATCKALDELRGRMAKLPGTKELFWVTYGFPSSIRMAGNGWWDGTPILRQLGTRFMQSGVAIYTADPGMNLTSGILNRDALDILAGATGGRAFSTIDLEKAIAQIEAGTRGDYSLEYRPAAKNWDGKYHKLRVTVERKGVRVQSENGYYAEGS
jgi:VWFA-related protein